MTIFNEKIKELVSEIEKKPELSFKETLVDTGIFIAVSVGLLEAEDVHNKSTDEKLIELKKVV